MHLLKPPRKEHLLAIFVTIVLTSYQLIRVIDFANVYGGIEHDSGWFLTVSRSLVERGTYTSMVSTIEDPTVSSGINVDGKFDIQAADGRVWFFAGSGTGPGSIVPDALLLNIFGLDFWALRAGPLIFYTLFLALAAYILYQLASVAAILLFNVFLFCYPHISIFLSYEALGEVSAMFYILWTYLAFAAATRRQHPRLGHFFATGLIAGLAINTKLLALLSISGVFIWAAYLWLFAKRIRLKYLISLGVGVALLQAVWELIKLVVLTHLTNFEQYFRHAKQRWQFVLDDGSGLGNRIYSGSEFIWRKFSILEAIAHPELWVTVSVFVGILLGGLALTWIWRDQDKKRDLLAPIWLGWLANTAWFVSMSKTGWMRHFWFGLVLAIILLCTILVSLIRLGLGGGSEFRKAPELKRLVSFVSGGLLLALVGWGLVRQPHVWGFYIPDEIVPYWQDRQANYYLPGAGLPWNLVPRAAQKEVVRYINHMPPEANVYYPANQKGAEIALQTGRIHYPLDRRSHPNVTPHSADILLIPASVLTAWRDPGIRQGLLQMVEQACPQPVQENDYYWICLADEVTVP